MTRRGPFLLLLLVLVVPGALAAWPMDAVDARRSGTSNVAIPTSTPTLQWNGTGQYTTILVATDGSVVGVGDPMTVWEPNGTVRWSTRQVGPQQQVYRALSGALLSDGTIVTVGALPFGAPAVIGYDPRTGAQTFFDKDIVDGCTKAGNSPIVVGADDSFYVGDCGPGIIAYKKDGTLKWSFSSEANSVALGATHVYATVEDLVLANSTVYPSAVVALSQADGSVAWGAKLNEGDSSPFVGADGNVYVMDAGYVTALAQSDGALRWRTIVARPFALGIAPNGTIAAASSSVMSWIAPADGAVLGTSPTKDGRILVLGEGVHLRSYGNGLAAVDAKGTTLWELTVASRTFQSNVALAEGGWVYVAEDGRMNAYRGEGGSTPVATPTSATSPTSTPTSGSPSSGGSPVGAGGDGGENGAPGPGVALLAVAIAAVAFLRRRSG